MRPRMARVGAPTCGEALGTSCSLYAFLASLGQKMQQALTAGKHHRGPCPGGNGPGCRRSYVMLVDSDIREGMRGILP